MINSDIDVEKHAQVRKDTGEVLAVGYFTAAPDDDNIEILEMTPEQKEGIKEVGISFLNEDGTITTEYVEPEAVQQPTYGDDGEMDNFAIIQAVSNLRLFMAADEPSSEAVVEAVKLLCRLELHRLKHTVRLV